MISTMSKRSFIILAFIISPSGIFGQVNSLSPCEQAESDYLNDLIRPRVQLERVYTDSSMLNEYTNCYEAYAAIKKPGGTETTVVSIISQLADSLTLKKSRINRIKVHRFKNASLVKTDNQRIEVRNIIVIGDSLFAIDMITENPLHFHESELQGLTVKGRFKTTLVGAALGGGGAILVDGLLGNPLFFGILFVAPLSAGIGGSVGFVLGRPIEYKYEPVANRVPENESTESLGEPILSTEQQVDWILVKQPDRKPDYFGSGVSLLDLDRSNHIHYRRYIELSPSVENGQLINQFYLGLSLRDTRIKVDTINGVNVKGYSSSWFTILYAGVEHFKVGTSRLGGVAFAEIGGASGTIRGRYNSYTNQSPQEEKTGLYSTVGLRGWYRSLTAELRFSYDTPTGNIIPSMVLGVRF